MVDYVASEVNNVESTEAAESHIYRVCGDSLLNACI